MRRVSWRYGQGRRAGGEDVRSAAQGSHGFGAHEFGQRWGIVLQNQRRAPADACVQETLDGKTAVAVGAVFALVDGGAGPASVVHHQRKIKIVRTRSSPD